ncbi:hypothetical protein ACJMK2_030984 [Sinanodonta woodiana]|uniref:Uncharacterized protein n=1 Tax=Sinanodonta woodiana TaxID=1069815 RepID=A0ABD3X1E9_SINWO
MDFLSGPSITAIADLLKPPEDEDSDGEDTKPSIAKLGPGNIGPSKTEASSEAKKETSAQKNSKDIWDEQEVPEGAEYESTYDPRPQPEVVDLFLSSGYTLFVLFLQDVRLDFVNPRNGHIPNFKPFITLFLQLATISAKLTFHLAVGYSSGHLGWSHLNIRGTYKCLISQATISRDFESLNP